MNREIKFKAKTTQGNKTVIGHLMYWAENYQIWETEPDGQTHNYSVKPESVKQFTGVKDANGVDLYEDDILTDGVNRHRIFYLESEASFKLEILKSSALMEYCALHQSWINKHNKALEEKKEEKVNMPEPSN